MMSSGLKERVSFFSVFIIVFFFSISRYIVTWLGDVNHGL